MSEIATYSVNKEADPLPPYKILHVYPILEDGGLEGVILNIVKALPADLFMHDVISFHKKGSKVESFLEEAGCTVHYIDPESKLNKISAGCYRKEIYNFILKRRGEGIAYDVVHAHHHRDMQQSMLAARDANVDIRILHSHLARQDAPKWRKALNRIIYRRHARGATHLVGCSQDAIDWIFPYKGNRPHRVIQNAIDNFKFRFDSLNYRDDHTRLLAKYGLPSDTRIFLNAGRCSIQKNQQFILRIAGIYNKKYGHKRPVLFLIAGQGELMESLSAEAARKGLDNVVFIGHNPEINTIMNVADAFLLPSIYEGWPLVAIEAQACALPVIASEQISTNLDAGLNIYKALPIGDDTQAELWADTLFSMPDLQEKERTAICERFNADPAMEPFILKGLAKSLMEIYCPGEGRIAATEETGTAKKVLIVSHPVSPSGLTGGDRVDRKIIEAAKERFRIMEWAVYPDMSWNDLGMWRKLTLPLRMLRLGMRIREKIEEEGDEGYWFFNSSKCLYSSLLVRALKRRKARTFSITHHPLYIQLSGWRRKFYRWAELNMLRNIMTPIAPSGYTRSLIHDALPEKDVRRIVLPFDFPMRDKMESGKQHRSTGKTAADSGFRLIFIGSIEWRKGLHHLLRAMEILRGEGYPVSLNAVGPQPDTAYLNTLRKDMVRMGLDATFEGLLTEEDKEKLLRESDVLVLPSSAEGYGMVLIEAMAAGIPVVAFRTGGMVEVIGENEERGLLAEPGDSKSLAACIRNLIINPSLRQSLICNGREFAYSHPSTEDFNRNILSILES